MLTGEDYCLSNRAEGPEKSLLIDDLTEASCERAVLTPPVSFCPRLPSQCAARYEYLYRDLLECKEICASVLGASLTELDRLLFPLHPSRVVSKSQRRLEYRPVVEDILDCGAYG